MHIYIPYDKSPWRLMKKVTVNVDKIVKNIIPYMLLIPVEPSIIIKHMKTTIEVKQTCAPSLYTYK